MMTSTGNPQGIAQAKKIITYAIISLVAIVGVGLFALILLFFHSTTRTLWMDETAVLEYIQPGPLQFIKEYLNQKKYLVRKKLPVTHNY